MAGALIKPSLPENALINVRHEVRIYFGDSNKLDDNLIDSLIDEGIKKAHRRWHFSWTLTFINADIPIGTGVYSLPVNFKKLFKITEQALVPETEYWLGADYALLPYNTQSPPRRRIQWLEPPSTALPVKINYYRKPVRANKDTDLIDIETDATDVVKKFARAAYMAQKSNLKEYDRMMLEAQALLQDYIDDDTFTDDENEMRPQHADRSLVDYSDGELI